MRQASLHGIEADLIDFTWLVSLLTLKGQILMVAATVSHFLSLFLSSSIGRKIAAFLAASLSSQYY